MTADHAYVLTPTDVRNIRNYVLSKYAAMNSAKRAEIVADAVSRIIHRQLPDFDYATKHRLTSQLIRMTVLEEKRPVSADDIYALCMELDLNDESIRLPLDRWLRDRESNLEQVLQRSPGTLEPLTNASSTVTLPNGMPEAHTRRMRRRFYLYGLLSLFVVAAAVLYSWSNTTSVMQGAHQTVVIPQPQKEVPAPAIVSPNELPNELKYADVDRERLTAYLRKRNSLLAEEPYLNAILQTAKEFDIHPAVLFAITGQEQSFVPASHKRAKEMANNPFNVFYSWERFNTTIEQSSAIAARTINRLSKDRPSEIDPFVWINREYAEDPNWSKGVASIFQDIMKALLASEQPIIK